MPKRLIVARAPQGKTTTIDPRLGEKGVPFGWQYIFCNEEEIPITNKLDRYWADLASDKRVYISTTNKEKVSVAEINQEYKLSKQHARSIKEAKENKLKELDVEFIRTFENFNQQRKRKAIIKFKEDLRKINPSLENFNTEKEFLDYWPTIFNKDIEDYKTKPIAQIIISVSIAFVILTGTIYYLYFI